MSKQKPLFYFSPELIAAMRDVNQSLVEGMKRLDAAFADARNKRS